MRLTAFLTSPAGTLLRYAISVALLAVVAAQVDWTRFHLLRGIDWPAAVGAALLAGVAYPLQAWRWQILLRAQGLHRPGRWVHRVFWISQFYNAFLPGGVAGDAVRFAHLWRHQPDQKAAAAAGLLFDRLLGIASLFALAALALGAQAAAGHRAADLEALLSGSVAAFALVVLGGWSLARTRWWEPVTRRVLGEDRARAVHDAATALGRSPGALALASAASIAVWLVDFAAVWLLARSVGLDTGPLVVATAAAAAYVAAALPISIGGHGVREGALVATFTLLGAPTNPLPLLALAFWAVSLLWSLVGGIVQLWPASPLAQTDEAAPVPAATTPLRRR